MRRGEIERAAEDYMISICHGPPRCDRTDGNRCPWCCKIHASDPRSIEQITEDMRVEH